MVCVRDVCRMFSHHELGLLCCAGYSRLLGGIHFHNDNIRGRQTGTAVGWQVRTGCLPPRACAQFFHAESVKVGWWTIRFVADYPRITVCSAVVRRELPMDHSFHGKSVRGRRSLVANLACVPYRCRPGRGRKAFLRVGRLLPHRAARAWTWSTTCPTRRTTSGTSTSCMRRRLALRARPP